MTQADITLTLVPLSPPFDARAFKERSKADHLDDTALKRLSQFWQSWLSSTHGCIITVDENPRQGSALSAAEASTNSTTQPVSPQPQTPDGSPGMCALFSRLERSGGAIVRMISYADCLKQHILDGPSYALIWLDENVEYEVDTAWNASPSQGFLLNSLAEMLCMECAGLLVPGLKERGCAPMPLIASSYPGRNALQEALVELGIPCTSDGRHLARRYSHISYHPAPNGDTASANTTLCGHCSLHLDCPGLKE